MLQSILEEIYEKQAVLESARSGVNDLLMKKPNTYGCDLLENELQDIVSKWKLLHDACKNR